MESDSEPHEHHCGEHYGIFTLKGDLPIQGAYRDICYEPVRGNIWTASEGIYRTIFVEGRKSVIAFDTFGTPGTARAYAGAMNRVFPNKPVETVVYSHEHLDHTGYAADLAPKAHIIAHEYANAVIDARGSSGQKTANETWNGERTEYDIDGCQFELIYPGPTHGDGNVAAYFPQHRTLFMVDTVADGVGYTTLMDWHLTHYVPVMKRFLSLDWDLFVPGHFWAVSRERFIEILDYWERLFDFAQEAIVAGVDPHDWDQLNAWTDEHLGPHYRDEFRYYEYAAMNLSRYMQEYLTGGWGIEGNIKPALSPL
ncbi:MBL fold metallo-hydrolase [Elongatibacter sediminis]|uniref:MBL fold metallo-hydrolase n=1 Tax=Elongatibacter sediminis TaxID=3119006 RepID=A0AAW9R661_9GAMM